MADFIIIAILVCIVGAIVEYLIRARKRGSHCNGCPYCGSGGCKSSCKDERERDEA